MKRPPAVGTVLVLRFDLGEMQPGRYVLTDVDYLATVHRLIQDEDGNLSPGGPARKVTMGELMQFEALPMKIPLNTELPD